MGAGLGRQSFEKGEMKLNYCLFFNTSLDSKTFKCAATKGKPSF